MDLSEEPRRAPQVAAFVPVGGTFLGSAKALAYPVSGEMTDTLGLWPMLGPALEAHGGLGRAAVATMTRSWSSVPALLPRGGAAFWNATHAGDFVSFEAPGADVVEALERDAATPRGRVARALLDVAARNATMDVDAALDWLRSMLPGYSCRRAELGEFSMTFAASWNAGPKAPRLEGGLSLSRRYMALVDNERAARAPRSLRRGRSDAAERERTRRPRPRHERPRRYDLAANATEGHRFWGNPVAAPLPFAPSLEIYCLYGVGRPTPAAFRFEWVASRAVTKRLQDAFARVVAAAAIPWTRVAATRRPRLRGNEATYAATS